MSQELIPTPDPAEQRSIPERIQERIEYHTGMVEELIIFRDKYANCALKDIAPEDINKLYMIL